MIQPVGTIAASVLGASVTVTGASAAAASAATIIVATGGAVALGMAGYGLYRYLSTDRPKRRLPSFDLDRAVIGL